MLETSMRGDRTLSRIYPEPNWAVITAMIARKRKQTPADFLALNRQAPPNATTDSALKVPTDDLMLLLINELECHFRTDKLAFVLGTAIRDGYARYLQGKAGTPRFGGTMKTEDDILRSHIPDMSCAKRLYQGTKADDRKQDLSRPWNSDNGVTARLNVSEVRVCYELMNYFGCDYRSLLVQLLHDAVAKYLEAGRAGNPPKEAPGDRPPIGLASMPKSALLGG